MKLYSIETGNLKLDGGAMFGVVPKVLWNQRYPAEEDNLCNWAMRCLLVEDGNRIILIDNGIGDKQDEKFLKHYYLNGTATLESSLKKHGFSFDDITDVIITHLHFDHCGGSIKRNSNGQLVNTCPKAKYWISKDQWEWALKPNKREKASFLKENILPIKENGQLHLIDNEGEHLPNIDFRLFNGHTAGQIIPHINYHGRIIAFMADLLPSTAHVPLSWLMSYDTRPLLTLEEKEQYFTEVITSNFILFFEHDIFNECCTLKNTEKGPRVDRTFTLSSIINQ